MRSFSPVLVSILFALGVFFVLALGDKAEGMMLIRIHLIFIASHAMEVLEFNKLTMFKGILVEMQTLVQTSLIPLKGS